MEKGNLKVYIIDTVNNINQTEILAAKETAFNDLIRTIREDLEGIDYMEYKDGTVTNTYINFDSCCGLSLITASADIEQLLEHTQRKDISLATACTMLSDICERDEYQDDLVDLGYNFKYSPADTADMLVSVLDKWKGEKELRNDFLDLVNDKTESEDKDDD